MSRQVTAQKINRNPMLVERKAKFHNMRSAKFTPDFVAPRIRKDVSPSRIGGQLLGPLPHTIARELNPLKVRAAYK
jgi:hypothetical protein